MDKIKRICDRATILRDGHYIATVNVAGTEIDEIISAMVGRKIAYTRQARNRADGEKIEVLRVSNLCYGKKVKHVSFSCYRGEILGIAGLIGAGRTETARLIYLVQRPLIAEKCL